MQACVQICGEIKTTIEKHLHFIIISRFVVIIEEQGYSKIKQNSLRNRKMKKKKKGKKESSEKILVIFSFCGNEISLSNYYLENLFENKMKKKLKKEKEKECKKHKKRRKKDRNKKFLKKWGSYILI